MDDLRSTFADRAGDLLVPDDLLSRVERGARRVRRRRALATGSGALAVVIAAAIAIPLGLSGPGTAQRQIVPANTGSPVLPVPTSGPSTAGPITDSSKTPSGVPAAPSSPPAVEPTSPTTEGLSFPVPSSWAFRGDDSVADNLLAAVERETTTATVDFTPLWGGTLGGTKLAVVVAKTGDAAGDVSIETLVAGSGGQVVAAGSQTLVDGIRAYAAILPGGHVLVLGPPGTKNLAVGKGTHGDPAAVMPAVTGAAAFDVAGAPTSIVMQANGDRPLYAGTISTRDSGLRD